MRRHTEQSIRWTNARSAAKSGELRTQRAIERHQAILDEARERQLNQTGNERDNGRVIERETKIIQRLIDARVRRIMERTCL